MSFDFEVKYIDDLSSLSEEYRKHLEVSDPDNRTEISQTPSKESVVVVVVFEDKNGDDVVRVYDRIHDSDSYLKGIQTNIDAGANQFPVTKVFVIGE